jgi:hypothetical protein
MANYIIIGGDGKEYGPVTAAEVRQWIAEGRLNPQSRVKAESDAEFRPLEKFPDFADAFAPAPIAPPAASATAGDEDYELDLFGCVSQGWTLLKNNFGVLFASVLVLIVVSFVFSGVLGGIVALVVPKKLLAVALYKTVLNYFLSAVSAVVMGPLTGGFYLVFLKTLRGQPVIVGDIFSGFQKSFSQLVLGYLAVVLVTGLCMAPFSYLSAEKLEPLLVQMQNAAPAEVQNVLPQFLAAFVGLLPLLLVCLVPLTYLTVNWLFTQALILDRQMAFGTAMKTSWRRVHRHWWQVFGLVVITGLLNVAGFFACCVGALVTVPVGIAALMIAYETIFTGKKN